MTLPITKLPAKILRTPTEPVKLPLNKNLRRLCKDMIETCKKAQGIGLAAPQVAKNLNLALIYLEEMGVPAFFLLNPTITKTSKETDEQEEGCLSMPGVFGLVKRPTKITLQSQTPEGKTITEEYDGWIARVIQHEVDHLNNILIIDKLGKVTHGAELLPKYKDT